MTSDIHPQSPLGKHLAGAVEDTAKILAPHLTAVEIVVYDPKDGDTYPSVCVEPNEVRERFGFVGGERLVFTAQGSYIGRLTDELEEPQ